MSSLPKTKCFLCNRCILCYKPISTILRKDSPWSWVKNHWSLRCIPTPYWPLWCMPHNCSIPKTLVDCTGYGTLSFVPLNADLQALHVLVNIMIMTIHSSQLRMIGQMTMLQGHQVLKNACIQLKLGVGTDSHFHYWSWQLTMVTLIYDCMRHQPQR